MKIAIVILNWNGKKLLEQFLPAAVSYSKEATIYIADNASTDDSINFLKENYPGITIIQNNQNGGYAKGYNHALQHIKADVYCLLNSDIEVTENWLQPVITQFKSDPNIAAIQPKILDYKNKSKFEYAGAAGGFIDKYGYPFCRGRVFDSIETDIGQYNDSIDIFWASGACFFIKSDIFQKLNGFDTAYFAHQEEIDLCWRIQNTGHTIKYVGTSTVYHVGGATLTTQNPKKTFLNFRNSLFNLAKNAPKNKGFELIFTRLCLDGLTGVKYVFELKPLHTLAIIKAHFSFYGQLPKMLKKRNHTPQKANYYQTKSIVWNYFVKGIKK
ncbi:MAG: dTDP-Rha--alpha-D-GlcNAc-pyrophosphate polyprenol alpha-3-L-rhamnosyltransferase [Kordia sp.]|nr:MAG: dTDP-Rha--alpha-D-GlcNAc-pyrophosphate polyprenol alpha-3-L-rhamnosyltransferase [Kordia sp.]